MSKPIYNLFLIRRPTDRFLRLSQARKNALVGHINEALAAAGGRRLVACDAYWSNEAYRAWGVEALPDFESWLQFAAAREKLEWYSYVDGWSMLGTQHPSVNPAEYVAPAPDKIYQLFLYRRDTEAHEQLPQPEREALWAREGETREGAQFIVGADSYWAAEEYQGFGVFMYPDIDAVQRHYVGLQRIQWPRYVRSRSLLGTLWAG
jgi:hypothetical protein